MPILEANGAPLYYEEHGEGYPILAFDEPRVLSDQYRVIVMDQRNAGGKSHGPIGEKRWLGQLPWRPRCASRPPGHRSLPPVRTMHWRTVCPQSPQGAARTIQLRGAGSADRPPGPPSQGEGCVILDLGGVVEGPTGRK